MFVEYIIKKHLLALLHLSVRKSHLISKRNECVNDEMGGSHYVSTLGLKGTMNKKPKSFKTERLAHLSSTYDNDEPVLIYAHITVGISVSRMI